MLWMVTVLGQDADAEGVEEGETLEVQLQWQNADGSQRDVWQRPARLRNSGSSARKC